VAPMALHFEPKHTRQGFPWQYIGSRNISVCALYMSHNTPIWGSHGTTFVAKMYRSGASMTLHWEHKHTDMGLPWLYILSLNTPSGAPIALHLSQNTPIWGSHGTTFVAKMYRSGASMTLHCEHKHTDMGLPWLYILSLNIPVWASHDTTRTL